MNTTRNSFLTFIVLLALVCPGCALLSKPPTALEKKVYDVQTNVVQQVVTTTNQVYQTNLVTQTITNIVNGSPVVTLTNLFVPVPVPGAFTVGSVTNYSTNYSMTPSAQTQAAVSGASTVLNTVFPGVGAVVGYAVAGLLGIWGTLRSKQANTLSAIAANAVQAIQVARNVTGVLSPSAAAAYDNFLVTHQRAAGIANQIAPIVDAAANSVTGAAVTTVAAQDILKAVETPIPIAKSAAAAV